MNTELIKIENGEITVDLMTACSNGEVKKEKEVALIIFDAQVDENGYFSSTLTPQQALEIASRLIDAVMADKTVTEEDKNQLLDLIENQKYNEPEITIEDCEPAF